MVLLFPVEYICWDHRGQCQPQRRHLHNNFGGQHTNMPIDATYGDRFRWSFIRWVCRERGIKNCERYIWAKQSGHNVDDVIEHFTFEKEKNPNLYFDHETGLDRKFVHFLGWFGVMSLCLTQPIWSNLYICSKRSDSVDAKLYRVEQFEPGKTSNVNVYLPISQIWILS